MKFSTNKKENNSGFTLIEVMISIGLFTVIMIIGITAILGVNNTYRKSRSMRSAIDNLSFTMEDMARNMRLGTRYRCLNSYDDALSSVVENPLDGNQCAGIAFEPFSSPTPGDAGDQVIYYIDSEQESIFKSLTGDLSDSFPMNSVDLKIDSARSVFSVFGSSVNDSIQPSVLIRIAGTASSGQNSTEFNLQTTVSQRVLDINP
jgi:prepilin-type N-terminal cleavage/methylation domain-containing protein